MAHEDLPAPEVGVDMDPNNGRFLPGNRSKGGRPKGSISISTEIKKKLEEIEPTNRRAYLELLIEAIMHKAVVDADEKMIKLIWNYVDGMPQQYTDLTTDGKALPQPLLYALRNNDSDKEDSGPDEADTGDSGGD